LAPGVAAKLGISEIEAYWICKLHCQVQQEYDDDMIKGSGCCSARFADLLAEAKKDVPELANLQSEQSFLMLKGLPPEILTPTAFADTALSTVFGTRAFNFISGIGALDAVGTSVGAGPAVRLGKALKALGAGGTCRPDIISTSGGKTTVLDNKFKWKKGKDSFSRSQKRNYKRIDSRKKLRPVTGKQCGCG
jgi:hypothetical protein